MESLSKLSLVDETGKPFNERLERVLCGLLPRLERQFPTFNDEVVVAEILEEAGRRIADHERRSGAIEKLHGYAWVTVRNIATSRMRHLSSRLAQKTLAPSESEVALSVVTSPLAGPDQIESDVLFREVLTQLTREERLICVWKKAGFSTKEIAKHRGSSVSAVDTLFFRAKQKIRRILGVQESSTSCQPRINQSPGTLVTFPSGDGVDIERADGQSTSAQRFTRIQPGR
jgi:DNA-directed RNA polymerase specialized sigma24 family protein